MTSPAKPAPRTERTWDRLHLWQIQSFRDLLLLAAVIGIVWLGYAMRSVTTPLLVALGLAYLFEPLISAATRRYRVSRTMVVSGVLLSLILTVALIVTLSLPLIIRQSSSLVDDLRSGRVIRAIERAEALLPESLREPWNELMTSFGIRGGSANGETPAGDLKSAAGTDEDSVASDASPDDAADAGGADDAAKASNASPAPLDTPHSATREGAENLMHAAGGLLADQADFSHEERIRAIVREELDAQESTTSSLGSARYLALIRRGFDTASSMIGALVTASLLTFLIPFYFFFFSVSYPTVLAFGESLIPHANRAHTLDLLQKMDNAVAGFVRGRMVISVIVGVVFAVGWLICGVPYSIVLGVVVGVFNLVPYLSGVGLPVAIGLLAFEQLGLPPEARMSWLWIIGGPSIVFAIGQLLDGYVLTPLIAGKATDLDPVTILVAVLAGGSIAGFYGMLLAIPVMACLKILFREVLLPKIKKWTRGEAADPLPIKE